MGKTISIRFKDNKVAKVTGTSGSEEEAQAIAFGEAFLKAFPGKAPSNGDASVAVSTGLPSRPTRSKPAGGPRYDQQLDARTWLRANGYQDIAERIDRLIDLWKTNNLATRRNWWIVLAGSPSGKPSRAGGKEWPMLTAFRKRQGYPVHADAIERGTHELAPSVFAQKRWGANFKRATK